MSYSLFYSLFVLQMFTSFDTKMARNLDEICPLGCSCSTITDGEVPKQNGAKEDSTENGGDDSVLNRASRRTVVICRNANWTSVSKSNMQELPHDTVSL